MSDSRFLLSCGVITLLTFAGSRTVFAEDPHNIQPVTITNPDVSYGAGASSITVHGMRKGQANGPNDAKPLKQLNNSSNGKGGGGGGPVSDPVAQSQPFTSSATVMVNKNFEGLGNGFPPFSVDSAPPDTNGAVGATEYVQWVNESFAVFDKAGGLKDGPVSATSCFSHSARLTPAQSITTAIQSSLTTR